MPTIKFVTSIQSLLYFPLYIAINRGYFGKYNLAVEIIENTKGDEGAFEKLKIDEADFCICDPTMIPYKGTNGGSNHCYIIGTIVDGIVALFLDAKDNFTNHNGNLSMKDIREHRSLTYPHPMTLYAISLYKYYKGNRINVIEPNLLEQQLGVKLNGEPLNLLLNHKELLEKTDVDLIITANIENAFRSFKDKIVRKENIGINKYLYSALLVKAHYLHSKPEICISVLKALEYGLWFSYNQINHLPSLLNVNKDITNETIRFLFEYNIAPRRISDVGKKSWKKIIKTRRKTLDIQKKCPYEMYVNTGIGTEAKKELLQIKAKDKEVNNVGKRIPRINKFAKENFMNLFLKPLYVKIKTLFVELSATIISHSSKHQ